MGLVKVDLFVVPAIVTITGDELLVALLVGDTGEITACGLPMPPVRILHPTIVGCVQDFEEAVGEKFVCILELDAADDIAPKIG